MTILKILYPNKDRVGKEVDPKPEWQGLEPKEVARRAAHDLVARRKAKEPQWEPSGFIPVVVVSDKGSKNSYAPFVVDLKNLGS